MLKQRDKKVRIYSQFDRRIELEEGETGENAKESLVKILFNNDSFYNFPLIAPLLCTLYIIFLKETDNLWEYSQ